MAETLDDRIEETQKIAVDISLKTFEDAIALAERQSAVFNLLPISAAVVAFAQGKAFLKIGLILMFKSMISNRQAVTACIDEVQAMVAHTLTEVHKDYLTRDEKEAHDA
jgi:hypothetical protein